MEALSRCPIFRPRFSGQTLDFPTRRRRLPRVLTVSCKGSAGGKFSGEDADRRLAALRKRIHEVSMVERKEEAPLNWMEWEKKYYVCYEEDGERVRISTIMKRFLRGIASRRLAVGVLGLVALSVPTMVLVVFVFLVEILDMRLR
ncbi:hypothetical protein EJ110_NYTH28266 [Nymphaea thermarum]|nr:hypothetical protein EJ110_NYTH28266 [Nymphaea thermarum]